MIMIELPEMSLFVEEHDAYRVSIWDNSGEPGNFTEQHIVDSMPEVLTIIQRFLQNATGCLPA